MQDDAKITPQSIKDDRGWCRCVITCMKNRDSLLDRVKSCGRPHAAAAAIEKPFPIAEGKHLNRDGDGNDDDECGLQAQGCRDGLSAEPLNQFCNTANLTIAKNANSVSINNNLHCNMSMILAEDLLAAGNFCTSTTSNVNAVDLSPRSTNPMPRGIFVIILSKICRVSVTMKSEITLLKIENYYNGDILWIRIIRNLSGNEEIGVRNNTTNVAREPMSLREAVACNEKSTEPRRAQRGDYWVLYNYVPMSMAVKCWESVTYTTHADYTFLDNLEPLLERWRAPISIAMHAPGTDFPATLDAIRYSRNCGSPLVSQLVTFHVFFSSKHVPKVIPPSEKIASDTYNCSLGPPWVNVSLAKMYKNEKKLLYPVNVGRNIARESAPTFYVFPSDIELYPSPNLPDKFLEMIRKRDQPALHKPNPKVFVLSIFEVDEKSQPPNNKTRLIQMLKAGTAIPFHKKLCSGCHNVPKSKEWQETPETENLHVFHVGKRTGSFVHWEPIFIGTNNDPFYDERLSWEGKSDKMTQVIACECLQGYALCVLDYDFLILDNAFLVHRPGIKIFKKDPHRDMLTAKTNALIKKIIMPELKVLYGTRKGCAV
ncbi:N-acetyllactosaminide beta-1,3-N-acetylglucosaminyltransferase [Atta colombica]|uniref:N-acetyllactosaminide beta-1,3-N-acetylglucosaminyltransferase n=1 Tax=Atta colombica TaxID=520822 RepID=A0A195AV60_9HYME|nr:N-acetyllactosaminide beta-1,3-N-acetylglucosaminyltransferase [Atta colombica]